MTPKEKMNLLITHFVNSNFIQLEIILCTPSEPKDVTFNSTFIEPSRVDRSTDKTVLAEALEQWQKNKELERTKPSYDETAEQALLNQHFNDALSRLEIDSPATIALLSVFCDSGLFKETPAYAKVATLYSAVIELTADAPTLSQHTQYTLIAWIIGNSNTPKYFKDFIQYRLAQSSPAAWGAIVRKIWSFNDHPQGDIVASLLTAWLQLDAHKWSRIIDNECYKYFDTCHDTFHIVSNLSLTYADILRSADRGSHHSDLMELTRKLTLMINYRLRCYLTQSTTASFLSQYLSAGMGEKTFFLNHLKLWLPHIVQFLHLTHNSSGDKSEDFSWLKTLFINDCLSSYWDHVEDRRYSSNDKRIFRAMIADMNAATLCATKLGTELSHAEDTPFSAAITELFRDALKPPVAQAVSTPISAASASTELQSAVITENLSTVWDLTKDRSQTISSLDATQRTTLLHAARQAFINTGAEVAFEILCRFYDDKLPMSVSITPQDDPRTINLKNQSALREIVCAYMQNLTNNNAVNFFAQLINRKIMFPNSHFESLPNRPTLFHIALSQGYPHLVDFLITRDVDPNWLDSHGFTPIQCGLLALNRAGGKVSRELRDNILNGLTKVINYHKLDWRETSKQPPLLIFAINQNCPADVFKILLNSIYCDPKYLWENGSPLIHLVKKIGEYPAFDLCNILQKNAITNLLKVVPLFLAHPKVDFSRIEEISTRSGDTLRIFMYVESFYQGRSNDNTAKQLYDLFTAAHVLKNILSTEPTPIQPELSNQIFSENNQLNDYKEIFQNHFAAAKPHLLGIILQRARTLHPAIEQWMDLSAAKWSRALADAGKEYASHASSVLSATCAHDIQLKTAEPDIDELQRQFKVVLTYQLRCHLEDVNKDKKFYTTYLASLLPHVTAFMHTQLSQGGKQWLKELLKQCLNEPVSASDAGTLRDVIAIDNLGPNIRSKLCTTFGAEIGQIFTQELNASFAPQQNSRNAEDGDSDNHSDNTSSSIPLKKFYK